MIYPMTDYSIVGIRFQMGDQLTYQEQTEAAARFVAKLEVGQRVLLVAEPENPWDASAVAAYIDYERIGYVNKEETAEVHQLLGPLQQCEAAVARKDHRVHFSVSIPGAPEKPELPQRQGRVLPESPLGAEVRMPFTKAESKLQMVSKRLMDVETDSAHLPEIISLAEHYAPLVKTSICQEDNFWLEKISKKLRHVCEESEALGLSAQEAAKMKTLYKQVNEAASDIHSTKKHIPQQVFIDHLDRLRQDESVNSHLYGKYCETFLDCKSFDDAGKAELKAEYERLTGWLRGLGWSELRNPHQLDRMGLKVNYLRLSRQELYELYSVLLVIERMEPLLPEGKDDEVIRQLIPICYGSRQDAEDFYHSVQGMKPTAVTALVNRLVIENKISALSKKRDLWKVLHDAGLYKPTESNWNLQVD